MLTLLLLRHAKSSWDQPDLRDHDRVLSARGRRDAPRMGAYLAERGPRPDLIVCSTAERAQETLRLVQPAFGEPEIEVQMAQGVYEALPSHLIDQIRAFPDDKSTVLVVGHNPGMHGAALGLIGRGETAVIRKLAVKYPTAALAVLEFDTDHWAEVRPTAGYLKAFVRPKDLPA